MPRRSILEGWPVYRRMTEIDDMVTYTPAAAAAECKMERSFDNDELDVTCTGIEESKGDSPMVDEISYEHDLVRTLDAI